jgi:hypothetical protein
MMIRASKSNGLQRFVGYGPSDRVVYCYNPSTRAITPAVHVAIDEAGVTIRPGETHSINEHLLHCYPTGRPAIEQNKLPAIRQVKSLLAFTAARPFGDDCIEFEVNLGRKREVRFDPGQCRAEPD